MADYAKKTVAELQEILKSRGLASSGKKAELVARLNENDKQAEVSEEALPVEEPEPVPATESAEPTTAPITTNNAPTTQSTSSAPQPVSDPTETATDKPSPDTSLANQTNYALNLPTSSLDNELAKRKARAERFGISAPAVSTTPAEADNAPADATTTTEQTPADGAAALKNLERAKRFGTGQTAIGKLDEALPSELGRGSRKRGHGAVAEASELDDPGLKRGFANRGRGGSGRGRGGGGLGGRPNNGAKGRGGSKPGAAKPQGIQKPSGGPAFTSDKDRLAAEARKKKFATA